MSPLRTGLISLVLATAIHLDWHIARPAHHNLSLGWTWHWALAIPIFGVAAWLVARGTPERAGVRSAAIIAAAALLGGVIEPVWEYLFTGASSQWAFGWARTQAFLVYATIGICAWLAVFAVLRRRGVSH